jgi:hypothetical protein
MAAGGTARIDVILGRCDDMRAEVYVRAGGLPIGEEPATIMGTLSGPETRLAVTLPTVGRLVDLGPGPDPGLGGTALARCILTEPGYWTPELPHRYRLEAEVRAGGKVVASCRRLVGLRRLGVRGRSLWLEGRRWVPRGVACAAGELEPAVFREVLATAVMEDPAVEVCEAADAAGVAIIARCGDDAVAACGRWAEHASVMLAVLPARLGEAGVAAVEEVGRRKSRLPLAVEVDGSGPPPVVPRGVDCLVVSLAAGALPHSAWREPPAVPVLAMRPAAGSVRDRRAACDRLQADLAAWRAATQATWDWAGYAVGPASVKT